MNIADFDEEMQVNGWCVFPNAIGERLVAQMRRDCLKWVEYCRELQIARKINEAGDGTAHHAVGGGDSIDEFVNLHLFHTYMSRFFKDAPYIMHACNPVAGPPGSNVYIHKLHRDVRTYIPNYHMRINMLVMLDDFTVENGATLALRGSHNQQERPDEDMFERNCEPILGKAGSVVLFNSYLWHRGGLNTTTRNRVALTLSFGPAFIKPQIDYARYLGDRYGSKLSELSRQVLGYNARVPVSLDEWYRTPAERLYWANQGG